MYSPRIFFCAFRTASLIRWPVAALQGLFRFSEAPLAILSASIDRRSSPPRSRFRSNDLAVALLIVQLGEDRVVVILGSAAPPTPLIEITTIAARGLTGHPVKCGGECARLGEADIERNRGDGQLTIRQ